MTRRSITKAQPKRRAHLQYAGKSLSVLANGRTERFVGWHIEVGLEAQVDAWGKEKKIPTVTLRHADGSTSQHWNLGQSVAVTFLTDGTTFGTLAESSREWEHEAEAGIRVRWPDGERSAFGCYVVVATKITGMHACVPVPVPWSCRSFAAADLHALLVEQARRAELLDPFRTDGNLTNLSDFWMELRTADASVMRGKGGNVTDVLPFVAVPAEEIDKEWAKAHYVRSNAGREEVDLGLVMRNDIIAWASAEREAQP